jgi:polysaccharide chain length determinant protein (PEP-CTERM system associated)
VKNLKNLSPADYSRLIWRRRWFAIGTFALVSASVSTYAWFIPDAYRSESMIMVEPAAISQDYVRPIIRSTPEEQIAAIRSQVQSRGFLERMIQDFGLAGYGKDPKFSMDRTVLALGRNIQILNTSRNTFSISFSASDPQTAQSFTRRMVDTLIGSSSSSRKAKAMETDQFVDDQLRKTEQDLAAHEDKIKQFKMANLGQLPEQSMANVNAITALNTQLSNIDSALQQAKERQILVEVRTKEQKRLGTLAQSVLLSQSPVVDAATLNSSPAVNPKLEAKVAELAALTSRYTAHHPDVIRLSREVEDLKKQSAAASTEMTEMSSPAKPEKSAGTEHVEVASPVTDEVTDFQDSAIQFEAESIRNEIAKREKERVAVLAQIKAYQVKLNLAPAIEQGLTALLRQYDVLKQQYFNLQEKKSQAKLTANMETDPNSDTYKVIDEANLPEKAAFPNRMQLVFVGLGAGLVLGVGAAFGRELLDATLGSEDEVASVLKLPVLGSISEIPRKQPRRLIGSGRLPKSA